MKKFAWATSLCLIFLFGTYMFNSGFGIEGGYIDFGEPNDDLLGQTARFNSGGALGLRAEFEWFDIDDADAVWMASVGIEFRF